MVVYSDSLVKEMERTLREGFNDSSIQLNRRSDRKSGPFKVVLQDSYETGTRLLEGRFASQIRTPGVYPKNFYFGLVAVFEVSQAGEEMHAHVLQHVSLSLFQSYPDGDLHPVVRAEWDWGVVGNPDAYHAQPHWHFAQSPVAIESVVRILTGGEIDFGSTLIFEKLPGLGKAHFAMSHLWNAENSNSYKQDFAENDDFTNWFKRLVDYTAAQLVYICGGQASEVMEFQG